MVLKALVLEMEGWEQKKPGWSRKVIVPAEYIDPLQNGVKIISIHVWQKKNSFFFLKKKLFEYLRCLIYTYVSFMVAWNPH